jgi:hypothetical protein
MPSPKKWAGFVLAALMALTVPLAVTVAAAPGQSSTSAAQILPATRASNTLSNLPVKGTTATGDTFRGRLDITHFRLVNGVLTAVGNLTGTLRNSSGGVIGTVDRTVRLPVTVGGASTCDILHLKLGPLDLNLLGLQVHLNRVVLDITATAAPGNLLGNLLCAVAHLLDSGLTGSSLNQILSNLLNAVLGVLNL